MSSELSGERMVLVRALPPAAKNSACPIESIRGAKCELVGLLSSDKGKKTEILLEIKQSNQKKP